MQSVWLERIVVGGSLASVLIIIAGLLWSVTALRVVEPPLVLRFSEAGVLERGTLLDIIGIALTGLSIVGINYCIARLFAARGNFLGLVVLGFTLLGAILIFVAFRAIISVNVIEVY